MTSQPARIFAGATLLVALLLGCAAHASPRRALGVTDVLQRKGLVSSTEMVELARARNAVRACLREARKEPSPVAYCTSERIVVQQLRLAILKSVRARLTASSPLNRLIDHRIDRTQRRLDKMMGR